MTTLGQPELTKSIFIWTEKHQIPFHALKIALNMAPLLGYLNFTREFILETDASLKGLGGVLSQQDNTGKVCVIAYVCQTLRAIQTVNI